MCTKLSRLTATHSIVLAYTLSKRPSDLQKGSVLDASSHEMLTTPKVNGLKIGRGVVEIAESSSSPSSYSPSPSLPLSYSPSTSSIYPSSLSSPRDSALGRKALAIASLESIPYIGTSASIVKTGPMGKK